MTDEYMTLQEALATGLPFKHQSWGYYMKPHEGVNIYPISLALNKEWQVQRPKPKVRVWQDVRSHLMFMTDRDYSADAEYVDVTNQLKEILKDEE
jgi:hypothetical protein